MSSTLSRPLSPKVAGSPAWGARVFSLALALPGLVLLTPMFLFLAVLIRRTSPGPALHRAQRVGQHGRLFRLFKFRTMVAGADSQGPGLTAVGDPRITPLGRWLRRTKLDELPQLLNIIRGDMNLVGPRPEDPRYVALYTPEQRQLLLVLPGLTSPASLHYRREEQLLIGADWETLYLTQVLPDKLQLELDYLQHRTLLTDLAVFLKTFRAVIP